MKIGHVLFSLSPLLLTSVNVGSDAFDKAARLLDLHSSTQASGAIIEHYTSLPPLPPFDNQSLEPLPMSIPEKSRISFSFSGLVSATERRLLSLRNDGTTSEEAIKREMSRVFQTAVVGHLCKKLEHAIDSIGHGHGLGPQRAAGLEQGETGAEFKGQSLGGLVVSGGVASNLYLRTQ